MSKRVSNKMVTLIIALSVLFIIIAIAVFRLTRPIGCINPVSPSGKYYDMIGYAPAWKCYWAELTGQDL